MKRIKDFLGRVTRIAIVLVSTFFLVWTIFAIIGIFEKNKNPIPEDSFTVIPPVILNTYYSSGDIETDHIINVFAGCEELTREEKLSIFLEDTIWECKSALERAVVFSWKNETKNRLDLFSKMSLPEFDRYLYEHNISLDRFSVVASDSVDADLWKEMVWGVYNKSPGSKFSFKKKGEGNMMLRIGADAFYNPLSKRISFKKICKKGDDGIFRPDIDIFFGEIGHSLQFYYQPCRSISRATGGIFRSFLFWPLDNSIGARRSVSDLYCLEYSRENSLEYEAHTCLRKCFDSYLEVFYSRPEDIVY